MPTAGALLLFRLGQRYEEAGLWPLVAEVDQLLAERYPEHPLVRPAQLWLLHYYTSGEVAWRLQRSAAARQGRQRGARRPAWNGPPRWPNRSSGPARSCTLSPRDWLRAGGGPAARGRREASGTLLSGPKPAVPVAVCGATVRGASSGWPTRRARRRGPCYPASPPPASPHLDGHLDDAIWKQAERAELHGVRPEENCPASVQLAL